MPELPEVETTRRGIEPAVAGERVGAVVVREPRLRWSVPRQLPRRLGGARVERLERRAKYLLLRTDRGTAIVHLGMSGSLRMVPIGLAPGRHDHVDIAFRDFLLRLHDPRRFGALLWSDGDPLQHRLLAALGVEPLEDAFDGTYLYRRGRGRRRRIKDQIMDARVVVGVGNIYASEALHVAGVHPARAAGRLSLARCERLATAIKSTLRAAIDEGGTTLRDYVGGDGRPGRFGADLRVYGRGGAGCVTCGGSIRRVAIGQRSTYYCPRCQR